MHCIKDLLPVLHLVGARDARRASCCFGGGGYAGRFADDESSGNAGTVGVVFCYRGEREVSFVVAKTGHWGEGEAVGQGDVAQFERSPDFGFSRHCCG